MSLPRKGLRKIEIGGVTYEWLIRKKPTYSQGLQHASMNVAIQLQTDSERCLLVVDLVVSRPDNWINPHQTGVHPKLIETIINSALEAGWIPDKNAPTFNHTFGLIRDRPYTD